MKCRDAECDAEIPEGARYCAECGLPATAALTLAVAASAENPPPEAPPPEQIPEATNSPAEAAAQVATASEEVKPPAEEQQAPTPQPAGPVEITIEADSATHIGLAKDEMEDALVVETVLYPARDPQFAVIALIGADGIGGSGDAGEVFAQTAVHAIWMGIRRSLLYSEQFMKFYETATREQCWNKLLETMQATNPNYDPLLAQVFWANSCIRSFAQGMFTPEKFAAGGFGCTVAVAVVICDLKTGRIVIHGYNEGDAPIYLIVNGQAETLSTEHIEEVVANDQRNSVLSRWLGRCDTPGGTRFTRELTVTSEIKSGCVMICSDGLANMLSLDQINAAITNEKATCWGLTAQALAVEKPHSPTHNPGDDNILVATAKFEMKEQ